MSHVAPCEPSPLRLSSALPGGALWHHHHPPSPALRTLAPRIPCKFQFSATGCCNPHCYFLHVAKPDDQGALDKGDGAQQPLHPQQQQHHQLHQQSQQDVESDTEEDDEGDDDDDSTSGQTGSVSDDSSSVSSSVVSADLGVPNSTNTATATATPWVHPFHAVATNTAPFSNVLHQDHNGVVVAFNPLEFENYLGFYRSARDNPNGNYHHLLQMPQHLSMCHRVAILETQLAAQPTPSQQPQPHSPTLLQEEKEKENVGLVEQQLTVAQKRTTDAEERATNAEERASVAEKQAMANALEIQRLQIERVTSKAAHEAECRTLRETNTTTLQSALAEGAASMVVAVAQAVAQAAEDKAKIALLELQLDVLTTSHASEIARREAERDSFIGRIHEQMHELRELRGCDNVRTNDEVVRNLHHQAEIKQLQDTAHTIQVAADTRHGVLMAKHDKLQVRCDEQTKRITKLAEKNQQLSEAVELMGASRMQQQQQQQHQQQQPLQVIESSSSSSPSSSSSGLLETTPTSSGTSGTSSATSASDVIVVASAASGASAAAAAATGAHSNISGTTPPTMDPAACTKRTLTIDASDLASHFMAQELVFLKLPRVRSEEVNKYTQQVQSALHAIVAHHVHFVQQCQAQTNEGAEVLDQMRSVLRDSLVARKTRETNLAVYLAEPLIKVTDTNSSLDVQRRMRDQHLMRETAYEAKSQGDNETLILLRAELAYSTRTCVQLSNKTEKNMKMMYVTMKLLYEHMLKYRTIVSRPDKVKYESNLKSIYDFIRTKDDAQKNEEAEGASPAYSIADVD